MLCADTLWHEPSDIIQRSVFSGSHKGWSGKRVNNTPQTASDRGSWKTYKCLSYDQGIRQGFVKAYVRASAKRLSNRARLGSLDRPYMNKTMLERIPLYILTTEWVYAILWKGCYDYKVKSNARHKHIRVQRRPYSCGGNQPQQDTHIVRILISPARTMIQTIAACAMTSEDPWLGRL